MSEVNLKQLGSRLKVVDELVIRLVAERMRLAALVGGYKIRHGEAFIRPEVEDARVAHAREIAAQIGVNGHFAAALMYELINESCKSQLALFQDSDPSVRMVPGEGAEWDESLRRNLLELTASWADKYDRSYDSASFATKSCLQYEAGLIDAEIGLLPDRSALLDLGCATGRIALSYANKFKRVVGFDLSGPMIEKAQEKAAAAGLGAKADFRVADAEKALPLDSGSISLAVMNLGTAGDIRDISLALREIGRVLRPSGRFFLSFYNLEALIYRWDFLPWKSSLSAVIDTDRHCLSVDHGGGRRLAVYAKPYTANEVADLLGRHGLTPVSVCTYPTVSPILPEEILSGDSKIAKEIEQVDRALAQGESGAYIIVSGRKK